MAKAKSVEFGGFARRGRPTSALRLWARENAPKVKRAGKATTLSTVADGVTIAVPGRINMVAIPWELTRGKTVANVGELVKLGAKDAGLPTPNLRHATGEVNGSEVTVFFVGYGL